MILQTLFDRYRRRLLRLADAANELRRVIPLDVVVLGSDFIEHGAADEAAKVVRLRLAPRTSFGFVFVGRLLLIVGRGLEVIFMPR